MSSGTRRATAALPVALCNNPAPGAPAAVAAARSPFQALAVRSQVPAVHPAVSDVRSLAANACAPPSHGGEGGEARSDDPIESKNAQIP